MAAERGFHIALDKPGSQDDKEFDALINKVEKSGTVFWMNYMYRYNPAVMYAYAKITNGDIGEVICIEGQMNTYHGEWLQQRYAQFDGGVMYYLGCHMTDIITRFWANLQMLFLLTEARAHTITFRAILVWRCSNIKTGFPLLRLMQER